MPGHLPNADPSKGCAFALGAAVLFVLLAVLVVL